MTFTRLLRFDMVYIPYGNIITGERFPKNGNRYPSYSGKRTKAEPTEIDLCAISHRPKPDFSYNGHSDTRIARKVYIAKFE